ncbi:MAG: efflux RND transporter periplasmic adaptor subunit [Planctomycetes bacterium]|nr:efflux RND transporter periplasmic adaptor subunit [Planctomycetota bacterium]
MLRKLLFLLLGLGLPAAVGLAAWSAGRALPPTVQVVRPRPSPLATTLVAQGRMESVTDATVRARVEGLVLTLAVDQGDAVRLGQELLRFDVEDAANRLAQSDDRLLLARAELKDAERELRQARSLVGVASESQARLDASDIRREKAALSVTLAEREVALTRTHLGKLSCLAPQAGVVLEKLVEAGQWVTPGQPLFKVADTLRLKVAVHVDEADAPAVRRDLPCTVSCDSLPGETFPAHVTKISPVARIERDATVVVVTSELTVPTDRLKIGNQVDVRIVTHERGQVLAVPVEAIRTGKDGRFAWVVEGDLLRTRPLKIGLANAELAEVLEGVTPDDRVVVSLGLELVAGERVSPVDRK